MSIKNQSRSVGRMIRRITGIELPICMKIAKMIIQRKLESDIIEKFPSVVKSSFYVCGDKCCSYNRYHIMGKRGFIDFDYSMRHDIIRREYSDFLQRIPFPSKQL